MELPSSMSGLFFKIFLVFLLFLVTFLLSLFSTALATSSRISLSRLLEDRNKKVREKILEGKEELRIAVEVWRTIFLAAFLLSLLYYFPRLHLWTIWALLFSLALVFLASNFFLAFFTALIARQFSLC